MQRPTPFQGWRLTFFQGMVFAVFVLFGVRMYQLQVSEHDDAQAAVNENRLSELPVSAPRGVIRDRNDVPLAVNVPAYNVTIIPASVPANEDEVLRIYNRLSALTGVPPTRAIAIASGQDVRSIEELVAEGEGFRPYSPVVIAQDVGQRVAMQILEESYRLPGVAVEAASVREYPSGELTAQIIGYMGRIPAEQELELLEQGYNPAYDRIGYAGLEAYLEELLAGTRGRIVREVDVVGQPIGDPLVNVPPQPGVSLRLTLDSELQQAAETALRNRIAALNAERGQIVSETGVVIAMNPQTGEVLALVSYPSYDNSRFARNIDVEYYLDVAADPLTPLVNHSTQSLYPPGSVWKLITALGVLQEDVIDPSTFLNDPGDLLLPNRYAPNDRAAAQRFVCWLRTGHGNLDMIGAIAQSCDVYFYQVGGGNPEYSTAVLRDGGLGINDLFRYATAMGIGSKLGIELPFENAGRMPDQDWKRRLYGENWSTGDTYNAAFGQGYINVTPLQLASAVATIANGGTLYRPSIIRDTFNADGEVVDSFEPEVIRTVNIDNLPPDQPVTLLLVEDMIMRGEESLACTCEPDSEFYNPIRCNPATYTGQVNVAQDELETDWREYIVNVPDNYDFADSFCAPIRFDARYRPPFVTTENFSIVQQGMRFTVTNGTAQTANLPYVMVAGKTGTAEYCDEIARPLGLCRPGNWPAHAWFTAYAPYENPEILIIGFVYNGGEGSAVALPIVVETMEAYFRLQNEREGGTPTEITIPETP
ncbi:MAG: penicillin-binding protein 2 [Chloroflexi bacterium]|nr:penicillin-binding protein 2 [Chloroflexota bacterium]